MMDNADALEPSDVNESLAASHDEVSPMESNGNSDDSAESAGNNNQAVDEVSESSIEQPAQEEAPSVEEKKAEPVADNATPEVPKDKKDWYILKVQVNREDRVKDNLMRRVKLAGMEQYFDEVLVPTEKVSVVKNGQRKVTKRKLYPGYLMVRMEINDDTWFLVRETSGIGDFTGSGGKPVPMLPHEVEQILRAEHEKTDEAPKLKIPYEIGDRVKIVDSTFRDVEGEVHLIDENTGRITVNITIFARTTPVELEYWQVEKTEN